MSTGERKSGREEGDGDGMGIGEGHCQREREKIKKFANIWVPYMLVDIKYRYIG